jgi:hypothetical protein
MALTKKRQFTGEQSALEHYDGIVNEWQIYVDLFGDTAERDDEPVLVPLFPCTAFVPGNVGTMSARAARALAGIGTPEEVVRARKVMLKNRAKARH